MSSLLKLRVSDPKTHLSTVVFSNEGMGKAASQLLKLGRTHFFLGYDVKVKRHADVLARALKKQGAVVHSVSLAGKESTKSWATTEKILEEFSKVGADHQTLVVALGGGVVSDTLGFAASIYRRGIDWAVLPTTLLSQVDAAIGGKTAVNLKSGKNLVGAFHQPLLVWNGVEVLSTLETRDRISGLVEMLKVALAFDPKLYEQMKRRWQALLALEPDAYLPLLRRAVDWKLNVVAQDEKETKGLRRLLNLGHTFGHALEAATDFRTYRHGEAVWHGIRFASALSYLNGHWKGAERDEVEAFLQQIPVPSLPKALKVERLLPYLKKDKKSTRQGIGFVLFKKVGVLTFDPNVEKAALQESLQMIQSSRVR